MCGILGLVSAGRLLTREEAQVALDTLRHRGPDGAGIWMRDGSLPAVVLGHRRLAILDLSEASAQPMFDPAHGSVIVFNGEIYNYLELRDELIRCGHQFNTSGDTEVLLAAYRQWGERCVDRLNGMFALAIWDESKKQLFAARDRFGEKPFYFALLPGDRGLIFGSEIKSIVASGLLSWEIDDTALARYVQFDDLDAQAPTLLRGIQRLLPAQTLTAKWQQDQGWSTHWRCYWQLPSERREVSFEEASRTFLDLLTDSVRLRLRADVPVGSSLSGGLDSSTVVCLIHQLGAVSGQNSFSARMEDPTLDEGQYIAEVTRHTGVNAYEVTPIPDRLVASFSRLCAHMEEPFPATSMFAQYLVMELAAQQRTTVLLDGQGADELLAGYTAYFGVRARQLFRTGHIFQLLREHRQYAQLRGSRLGLRGWARLFTGLRRGARATGQFSKWWAADWLSSQIPSARLGPGPESLQQALAADAMGGPLQALLRYGDRNSMAWSRELRQPFLDHRIAEWVVPLPDEFKLGGGMTKRVLRSAIRGLVPDAIVDRHDKLGFQAPQSAWFSGVLRGWVETRLEGMESSLGGRTVRLVERFRGLQHMQDFGDARFLMRLLSIDEGLRQLKTYACRKASAEVRID